MHMPDRLACGRSRLMRTSPVAPTASGAIAERDAAHRYRGVLCTVMANAMQQMLSL